jgi:phosphonoacetate hydrolase
MIVNRVLNPLPHGHRLRNFDVFDVALNCVQ